MPNLHAPPPPPPKQQKQQKPQPTTSLHPKKSRFHFQIDTRAPAELHHLEDEVIRKRKEYKSHIHSLNKHLASILCTLDNEIMDADGTYNEMMERIVTRPLEQAVERVCTKMERTLTCPFLLPPSSSSSSDTTKDQKGRATAIERSLHSISSTIHSNAHVTFYDLRFQHLDSSVKNVLQNDVEPFLKLEQSKGIKVEGGMVRKFESCAASLEEKLAEEQVGRYSSLEVLKGEVEKVVNVDAKREEEFLEEIRGLRVRMRVEREEWRERDEEVVERILRTKRALQKIVLESLGESSGGGGGGVDAGFDEDYDDDDIGV